MFKIRTVPTIYPSHHHHQIWHPQKKKLQKKVTEYKHFYQYFPQPWKNSKTPLPLIIIIKSDTEAKNSSRKKVTLIPFWPVLSWDDSFTCKWFDLPGLWATLLKLTTYRIFFLELFLASVSDFDDRCLGMGCDVIPYFTKTAEKFKKNFWATDLSSICDPTKFGKNVYWNRESPQSPE